MRVIPSRVVPVSSVSLDRNTDLIIFSIVGMYAFHCAYKGLATRNIRLSTRYAFVQVPLIVFVFLSMILGTSNFNGWMNLRRAEDSDELSGFWTGTEWITFVVDAMNTNAGLC